MNSDLSNSIDEMLAMEDEVFHSSSKSIYTKSWEVKEFSSAYMIYALESLSRWEKNVRFIESEVLYELLEASVQN